MASESVNRESDSNQNAVSSEPIFDADYLRNPAPVYPKLSRQRKEEGVVLLRVHVLANGEADQLEVLQSSGFERLDEAALRAVRRWQFVPAKRGDETVAAWVRVPVRFNVNS
ncbi:energy transducer TonB [Permianibacter sp. IMCC34836]|uniref:energy transducer TonB n=1 Tax=Permianibacter fluminis TaxID=2738515 RepID=UPI00155680C0|nr:energy transducer TonB [Permianibacter fluminis]NQD38274.1 energy transducer TonB [Permianibacter fluminis]